MTPVDVEISRLAFFDMAEILEYIGQRSPQNADIVEAAFYRVVDQLSFTPTIGHIHPEIEDDSVKFVPFKSFEAAYRFESGWVRLIRVIHSSRDYTQIDWR